MRKIIYVINPISGSKAKNTLLKKIEIATQANNLCYEFMLADIKGDYEALKEKIKQEKITDVVIVGGDGTMNQVTGALRGYNVRFGIIPAGSGNGLAYTAAIPKNTDRALQLIFNQHTKKTDAFLVNDYYACMLSGLGFDATVAQIFAQQQTRGLMTYTKHSVLQFFKAGTYKFEIFIDNFSFETEAYFISIANSNQFGNNVTIAPKAKLNDGLLDVVIVPKMHKAKLPLAVLKQVKGNNKLHQFAEDIPNKKVVYFQTKALTIKNIERAPLHIDGDPYETAAEFKIKIINDCFDLIQP